MAKTYTKFLVLLVILSVWLFPVCAFANDPPYFTGVLGRLRLNLDETNPRLNVVESRPLRFYVQAQDNEGQAITYTDPLLPAGATLDPATRLFSWTPNHAQIGNSQITFRASDGTNTTVLIIDLKVLAAIASVDLSIHLPPVGNQGNQSSCASWAIGYYYKTFQEGLEYNWDLADPAHQCSPSFLYNQLANGVDEGSYFWDNLDIIANGGCAPLSSLPYSPINVLPNASQYEAGMPFRSNEFGDYYMPSIEYLRERLTSGDGLVVGISVYEDQIGPTGGNGVYDGPRGDSENIGGHGLMVVGFDDNRQYTNEDGQTSYGAFLVINSWGTGWGDHGYRWISYNEMAKAEELALMSDRSGYWPKAIASAHITHSQRRDLEAFASVGDFLWLSPAILGNNDFALDITDALTYLPPMGDNKWSLSVFDVAPSNTGTLDSFVIKYRTDPNATYQEFSAGDLPIDIPDNSASGATSFIPSGSASNHPPTQPTVTIAPAAPKRNDILVANASGSTDPDGDSVVYRYTWYKNAVLQPALVTNMVPALTTAKSQVWRCVVTPNDGKIDGPSGSAEVTIMNSAPVLSSIGNKTVNAGTFLGFVVSAADADSDTLTYSVSGLPPEAHFDAATHTFSWTPSAAGTYNNIIFSVSDGSLIAQEGISITVISGANHPPVLNHIGDKTVTENSSLTFTISATDPDAGDTLTYSTSGLPSGANFNATTHVFSWTPDYTKAGTYPGVRFSVSDGALTTDETITITVTNVNRAPEFSGLGDKTVAAGGSLTFTISATDPDGDTLAYTASGLPTGANFNANTQTFSWSPTLSQRGDYPVTFSVTDGLIITRQAITIHVTGTNNPPVLNPIGNKTVTEGNILEFTITATDPDGDTLIYTAVDLPYNASVNPGSGLFSWTPTSSQVGDRTITFRVSDGQLMDDEVVVISVAASQPNHPPVLTHIGAKSVVEESNLTFTVSATDPDAGDTLTYTATG
ncbi:MAG: putative Ig domain-containing protein, partial [Candidatus Omnitrophica bacterium]|nr:putative Ig domain-containing protein [Candidatus Omnitrophota bacterium]